MTAHPEADCLRKRKNVSLPIEPGSLSDAMVRAEAALAEEHGDSAMVTTCLLALGIRWEDVPGSLQVMRFPSDTEIRIARQVVCDAINARRYHTINARR